MKKSILMFVAILFVAGACSTASKINEGSAEIATNAGMLENAAYNIDRAIATEKRLEERFKKKKK
jgi:hypothetical protein